LIFAVFERRLIQLWIDCVQFFYIIKRYSHCHIGLTVFCCNEGLIDLALGLKTNSFKRQLNTNTFLFADY